MRKIALIILLFVLLSTSAYSAAIPNWPTFYQGWENETVDTEFDAGDVGGDFDTLDGISISTDCTFYVRDSTSAESGAPSAARAGDQYLDLRCTWKNPEVDGDTCGSGYGRYGFERASMRLEGDDLANGAQFDYDNGTEYWVGWSVYIPSNYAVQRHPSNMFQVYQSGGTYAHLFQWGGDGTVISNYYRFQFNVKDPSGDWSTSSMTWESLKGTWVDMVYRAVFYSSNNANAKVDFYINGVLERTESGTQNLYDAKPPYIDFQAYSGQNCGDSGDTNCADVADDYYDCDVAGWYRANIIDEIRINEYTTGQGDNYCDVAPAIWAATPTISAPAQGADDVDSDGFTAQFDNYADHRDDLKNCFDPEDMEIHIDESGGDWSTLVHDSGEVTSSNSYAVPGAGLSDSTAYQLRVRHSSLASGRATEYWGEWSDTIIFTTGPPDSVEPAGASMSSGGNVDVNTGGNVDVE